MIIINNITEAIVRNDGNLTTKEALLIDKFHPHNSTPRDT